MRGRSTLLTRAKHSVERREPITIGVPFRHQRVSGLGDPPALLKIEEARDRFAAIAQVRVEWDVVLIRHENVIVPAADQDLAGASTGSVEVAGGDAFGINRAALAAGKKASLEVGEAHLAIIERLVP